MGSAGVPGSPLVLPSSSPHHLPSLAARPAWIGGRSSPPVFSSSSLDWKQACVANTPAVDGPLKMDYIPPSLVNGKRAITLTEDEVLDAEKRWKNSLIGYVLGNRPYFPRLKAWITKFWKPKSAFEVFSRENGFFIFQFGSEEDKNYVLEQGPWFIDGKPFILRNWDATSGLDRDLLSSAPVWIRLYGINLKATSRSSITKMASFVGKPLMMDKPTANLSRLDFARCLVEVDAAHLPPTMITVYLPDGSSYEQTVFYEYLPARCALCSSFGHLEVICPLKQQQSLTPLATATPAETTEVQQTQTPSEVANHPKALAQSRSSSTPLLEALKASLPRNRHLQPDSGPPTARHIAGAAVRPLLATACNPSAPQIPYTEAGVEMCSPTQSNAEEKVCAPPTLLTADPIEYEPLEKADTSPQVSDSSSDDVGECSSEQPALQLELYAKFPRRNLAELRSKSREESFQDFRSFSSRLGQKLAKSASSKEIIRDPPQGLEQPKDDGGPFIEVTRKKSKQARDREAGDHIRASPRIAKPNPKYL